MEPQLERRLALLQMQMQRAMTLLYTSVSELDALQAEIRGQGSAAGHSSVLQDSNPFDLLHGSFQPRTVGSVWPHNGVVNGRVPAASVQAQHAKVTAQQQIQAGIHAAADAGTSKQEDLTGLEKDAEHAGVSVCEALLDTQVLGAETPLLETAVLDDGMATDPQDDVVSSLPPAAAEQEPANAAAVAGQQEHAHQGSATQQERSDMRMHQQPQKAQQQWQRSRSPQHEEQLQLPEGGLSADLDGRDSSSNSTSLDASSAGTADYSSNSPSLGAAAEREEADSGTAAAAAQLAGQQEEQQQQHNDEAVVYIAEEDATHTGMIRVHSIGRRGYGRTVQTYTNDETSLRATDDGELMANTAMPYELAHPERLPEHLHNIQAWVLANLSHECRKLGWKNEHQEQLREEQEQEQQQEEQEELLQLKQEQAQQQYQDGSQLQQQLQQEGQQQQQEEDMEQQQPEAADVPQGDDESFVTASSGDEAAVPGNRRKQSKPVRKRTAMDRALEFSSDSEEQPPQHSNNSALASLLQQLSAAAAPPFAAGTTTVSSAMGTDGRPSTAAAGFVGSVASEAYAEMQLLVQEDIERLQQQWRHTELCKLQPGAAEIWAEQHERAANWQRIVEEQQAQLDKGVHEMVISNADNITKYKRERHKLCEGLEGWVFLLEGAKYVLSIVELPEPPTAAEGDTSPAAAADEAAAASPTAAANQGPESRRQRRAAVASSSPDEEDVGSGSGSDHAQQERSSSTSMDEFIENDTSAAAAPTAAKPKPRTSIEPTDGQQDVEEPAASHDASSSAATDEQQQQGENAGSAATWNVPHLAPGATQVLHVPGRRLKRLQQQAEVLASQQQQQQQQAEAVQQLDNAEAIAVEQQPVDVEMQDAATVPAAAATAEAATAAAAPPEQLQDLEDDIPDDVLASSAADHSQPSRAGEEQQQHEDGIGADVAELADVDMLSDELEAAIDERTNGEHVELAEDDESSLPAGTYMYSATVAKEDSSDRASLQLLQPCEVVTAVNGGEVVRFKQRTLADCTAEWPRWHSWESSKAGVAALTSTPGMVRLRFDSRPTEQALLANIRPSPPQQLASIIPPSFLEQYKQKQRQQQADTVTADRRSESPSASAAEWACSDEGLLHLSKAFRPGMLFEYRSRQSHNTWVPAVLLHSSLMRPALSDAVKLELQGDSNGRVTVAGIVSAWEGLRGSVESSEVQCYQAPRPEACVLVLQLLGGTCDVRHIKWHMLYDTPPCLRYMLHWVPDGEADQDDSAEQDEDAVATPRRSNSSGTPSDTAAAREAVDTEATAAAALATGTWQRLVQLRFWPMNKLVRSRLADEQKAWLKSVGWTQRGRRRSASAAALAPDVATAIARKLARRPTVAAVPPALVVAAGYGSDSSRQKRHSIRPRKLIAPGPKSPDIEGRKGRSPRRVTTAAEVQGRARHQHKRRQVLSEDSEPEQADEPTPHKRPCLKRGLRPRRGPLALSVTRFLSGADSDDEKATAAKKRRIRRNSAPAKVSADGVEREQQQQQLPSDHSEEELLSDNDVEVVQVDEAGGCLLYDDRPAGPLNPCLPKCWFTPGLPHDKQVIKPHQLDGLRFMWNSLVTEHADDPASPTAAAGATHADKAPAGSDSDDDFIEHVNTKNTPGKNGGKKKGRGPEDAITINDAGGCILAHSMGLGKSFQTIALLWLFFQQLNGRALLVVPTNVVRNWSDEFQKWLPGRKEPEYKSSRLKKNKVYMAASKADLSKVVKKWKEGQGTGLIISYGVFCNAVKEQDSPPAGASAAAARLAVAGVMSLNRGASGSFSRRSSADGSYDEAAADSSLQQEDEAAAMADPVATAAADEAGDQDDADDEQQEQPLQVMEPLRRKPAAEVQEYIRAALLNDASIIVADEAHQMKNAKAQYCRFMSMLHSRRRLALTGYPLQNNMEEYYQMIVWVQPEDVFMTAGEFKSKFTDPITEGQKQGAARWRRIKMARQLSVLQDRTAHFIQRAGPEILVRDLPPKHEYVLALAPTPTQIKLLTELINILKSKKVSLFRDIELMRKILCTRDHGYAVLSKAVAAARTGQTVALETGEDDMQLIIESQQPGAAAVPAGLGGTGLNTDAGPEIHMSQEGDVLQDPTPAATKSKRRGRPPASGGKAKSHKKQGERLPLEIVEELLRKYPAHIVSEQQQQRSGSRGSSDAGAGSSSSALLPKEAFIRQLVATCCQGERQEKVVIFSQSLPVLSALASMLEAEFGYKHGREYLRLQGEDSAAQRSKLITLFNRPGSPSRVFLISTRAGAVGINLVSARRLVLYDVPWNPVHNKQAVSRIWRYGQTKPCYLYHLMYAGTIEQHLYQRTLAKLELFARVVERQSKKAVLMREQDQLYALAVARPLSKGQLADTLDAKLPSNDHSDAVLRQLLQQEATFDALQLVQLENHEEQLQEDPAAKLTKEEKLRAAVEYERERRRQQAAGRHYAASQAAGGEADKGSARSARADRRWKQRLITMYGKDFEKELQQQEQNEQQAQLMQQRQQQQESEERARQQQLQLQELERLRRQQLQQQEAERVRQQQLQDQQRRRQQLLQQSQGQPQQQQQQLVEHVRQQQLQERQQQQPLLQTQGQPHQQQQQGHDLRQQQLQEQEARQQQPLQQAHAHRQQQSQQPQQQPLWSQRIMQQWQQMSEQQREKWMHRNAVLAGYSPAEAANIAKHVVQHPLHLQQELVLKLQQHKQQRSQLHAVPAPPAAAVPGSSQQAQQHHLHAGVPALVSQPQPMQPAAHRQYALSGVHVTESSPHDARLAGAGAPRDWATTTALGSNDSLQQQVPQAATAQPVQSSADMQTQAAAAAAASGLASALAGANRSPVQKMLAQQQQRSQLHGQLHHQQQKPQLQHADGLAMQRAAHIAMQQQQPPQLANVAGAVDAVRAQQYLNELRNIRAAQASTASTGTTQPADMQPRAAAGAKRVSDSGQAAACADDGANTQPPAKRSRGDVEGVRQQRVSSPGSRDSGPASGAAAVAASAQLASTPSRGKQQQPLAVKIKQSPSTRSRKGEAEEPIDLTQDD